MPDDEEPVNSSTAAATQEQAPKGVGFAAEPEVQTKARSDTETSQVAFADDDELAAHEPHKIIRQQTGKTKGARFADADVGGEEEKAVGFAPETQGDEPSMPQGDELVDGEEEAAETTRSARSSFKLKQRRPTGGAALLTRGASQEEDAAELAEYMACEQEAEKIRSVGFSGEGEGEDAEEEAEPTRSSFKLKQRRGTGGAALLTRGVGGATSQAELDELYPDEDDDVTEDSASRVKFEENASSGPPQKRMSSSSLKIKRRKQTGKFEAGTSFNLDDEEDGDMGGDMGVPTPDVPPPDVPPPLNFVPSPTYMANNTSLTMASESGSETLTPSQLLLEAAFRAGHPPGSRAATASLPNLGSAYLTGSKKSTASSRRKAPDAGQSNIMMTEMKNLVQQISRNSLPWQAQMNVAAIECVEGARVGVWNEVEADRVSTFRDSELTVMRAYKMAEASRIRAWQEQEQKNVATREIRVANRVAAIEEEEAANVAASEAISYQADLDYDAKCRATAHTEELQELTSNTTVNAKAAIWNEGLLDLESRQDLRQQEAARQQEELAKAYRRDKVRHHNEDLKTKLKVSEPTRVTRTTYFTASSLHRFTVSFTASPSHRFAVSNPTTRQHEEEKVRVAEWLESNAAETVESNKTEAARVRAAQQLEAEYRLAAFAAESERSAQSDMIERRRVVGEAKVQVAIAEGGE